MVVKIATSGIGDGVGMIGGRITGVVSALLC
jgi:hypothetical protein